MAKDPNRVAEEIDNLLRRSGKEILTFPWPDFYALNEAKRWTDERTTAVDNAMKRRGLVLAWGQMVVAASHDRNFSPLAS